MSRLQEIDKEISALCDEKEAIKRKRRWTCNECSRQTVVTKLIVVEHWWYTQPSGCSEGDYWLPGDDYYIWCDKCNTWIRDYKRHRVSDWEIRDEKIRDKTERAHTENKGYFVIKDNKYRIAELLENYNNHSSNFDLNVLRKKKEERYI